MKANTMEGIIARLVVQEDGCHVWPGARHTYGYGMVCYRGRWHLVHRLVYEHLIGPIPPEMVLDHFGCDNPPCANPAHLLPCSSGTNVLRGGSPSAQHARKTHCPLGHPYSGDNLRIDNRGARVCRECARLKRPAYAERVRNGAAPGRTPRREPVVRKPRANTIAAVALRLQLQPNGCAIWPGAKRAGYGIVGYQGKSHRVHKLLYENLIGPVPPGKVLDHYVCSNRACANVAHLRPATPKENVLRGPTVAALNASRTHCRQGHPYAGANLALTPDGRRYCKQCNRDRARARQTAARENPDA